MTISNVSPLPTRGAELRAGWRMILSCAFGVCFGMSGLTIFSFGVFILPLAAEYGWSRGQISVASSFLIFANAVTAPLVGSLVDRYGARRIAITSMCCLALGYLALSQLPQHLILFYAIYLTLAFAGGGTTNVVWTRAINLRFDRARGTALGLILAGSGSAAILAPILCTQMIEAAGWRWGYAAIGLSMLLIPVPVLALLFHERVSASEVAAKVEELGLSLKESLRTPSYWKLAGSFFLVSGCVSFIIVHTVPMLADRGMTPMQAAGTASLFGIAIVIGRLIDGALVDRFHAPVIGTVLFCISAAGCLLLCFGGAEHWVAVVAVVTFGLAGGAEVHLLAFLTSRYFGMRAYGKVYGLQLTSFYAAASLGPLVAGLGYDIAHSYRPVLIGAAILFAVGGAILVTLGRYPRFETAPLHAAG